jgi:hypothetical protein
MVKSFASDRGRGPRGISPPERVDAEAGTPHGATPRRPLLGATRGINQRCNERRVASRACEIVWYANKDKGRPCERPRRVAGLDHQAASGRACRRRSQVPWRRCASERNRYHDTFADDQCDDEVQSSPGDVIHPETPSMGHENNREKPRRSMALRQGTGPRQKHSTRTGRGCYSQRDLSWSLLRD